jgi:hypothetical protein
VGDRDPHDRLVEDDDEGCGEQQPDDARVARAVQGRGVGLVRLFAFGFALHVRFTVHGGLVEDGGLAEGGLASGQIGNGAFGQGMLPIDVGAQLRRRWRRMNGSTRRGRRSIP